MKRVICIKNTKPRRKIHKTMVLQYDELVQDIRNSAHIIAENIKTEDPNLRASIRDVAEMNNQEKMVRSMYLAVGEVATALQPFSAWYNPMPTLVSDRYKVDSSFTIHIEVCEKFPENVFWHLKNLAHDYIVAKALYDYLMLVSPEAAAVLKEKIDELMAEIRAIAGKQYGEVLRPFCP